MRYNAVHILMFKIYINFSENLSVGKFDRRKMWLSESIGVGKFTVGKYVSENLPSENLLSEKPPDTTQEADVVPRCRRAAIGTSF